MPDVFLIKQKFKEMVQYFDEIDDVLGSSDREIIDDKLKLRSLERLFQLVVDTALDINMHIIKTEKFQPFDDYQSTFITLGDNKVLPMRFADVVSSSVGLRNLVVHKYGKVDIKQMVRDIREGIPQYRQYIKFITKWLG